MQHKPCPQCLETKHRLTHGARSLTSFCPDYRNKQSYTNTTAQNCGKPPFSSCQLLPQGSLAASSNQAILHLLACCLSLPTRQILHRALQSSQRCHNMPVPPLLGCHDCNYPRKAWDCSFVGYSAGLAWPMHTMLFSQSWQQNADCFLGTAYPILSVSPCPGE